MENSKVIETLKKDVNLFDEYSDEDTDKFSFYMRGRKSMLLEIIKRMEEGDLS